MFGCLDVHRMPIALIMAKVLCLCRMFQARPIQPTGHYTIAFIGETQVFIKRGTNVFPVWVIVRTIWSRKPLRKPVVIHYYARVVFSHTLISFSNFKKIYETHENVD